MNETLFKTIVGMLLICLLVIIIAIVVTIINFIKKHEKR